MTVEHEMDIARTLGKMDAKLEALEAGQRAVFGKIDGLPCADHRVELATIRAELSTAVGDAVRAAVLECSGKSSGGMGGAAKSGGFIVALMGTIEAVKYYLKLK